MDKIDQLLLEAWNRISAKVRRDRVEALKRSRRRFKGVLTRPMREWCLVIRASDTRINDYRATVEPVLPLPSGEGWGEGAGALSLPSGEGWGEGSDERVTHAASALTPNPSPTGRGEWADFSHNPIESHQPHFVTLSGTLIRELTKPVKIPWPGVTYQQVADMLGRTKESLYEWVRKGVFRVNRYREFKYPEHGRRRGPAPRAPHPEHIARILGRCGEGRPYVWTPSPIDPNDFHGRTPHAMCGTLWQGLWQDLPEEYTLRVLRVPRERIQSTRDGPRQKFLGWEFVCPGRLDADRQPMGCGKRCTYLYGPQTVWTLAKALMGTGEAGEENSFEMPEDSGLAGQWFPGLADPVSATGPRSFACKTCWGVRSAVMCNETGWNDFITHISGGLLYDSLRPLFNVGW
jgi:hypothetical protein